MRKTLSALDLGTEESFHTKNVGEFLIFFLCLFSTFAPGTGPDIWHCTRTWQAKRQRETYHFCPEQPKTIPPQTNKISVHKSFRVSLIFHRRVLNSYPLSMCRTYPRSTAKGLKSELPYKPLYLKKDPIVGSQFILWVAHIKGILNIVNTLETYLTLESWPVEDSLTCILCMSWLSIKIKISCALDFKTQFLFFSFMERHFIVLINTAVCTCQSQTPNPSLPFTFP